MDTTYLGRDAKEVKEKMLDYVDEIVMRTDKGEPKANVETFQVENAARRIFKEMMVEFKREVEDTRGKIQQNNYKLIAINNALEKHEATIKVLATTNSEQHTFNKRLEKAEAKLEMNNENFNKRYDALKEHVVRTAETLTGKVEMAMAFN